MARSKKAFLVAGLGFGDEGKGSIVDFLTRKYGAHTIVRYNGGPQAAHTVVAPDGRHHVFAQFGSGTLVPGTKTHLSRFMPINPLSILVEEEHLRRLGITDALERLSVEAGSVIVTPYHGMINRLLELSRGSLRHGSCGLGVGQAMSDYRKYGNKVLFAGDLKNSRKTKRKLEFIKSRSQEILENIKKSLPKNGIAGRNIQHLYDEHDNVLDACLEQYKIFLDSVAIVGPEHLKTILKKGTVIFEGAQGVLLDQRFGSPPYVTKTDTTFDNAVRLLAETGYDGKIEKIGVLRGYATRHGPGPFPTEDNALTKLLPDAHNKENDWQGKFRAGYFDVPAVKYAIESIEGVDEVALTNLDRLIGVRPLKIAICRNDFGPEYKTIDTLKSLPDVLQYAKLIGSLINTPITILSLGPTADDKVVFEPYYNKPPA